MKTIKPSKSRLTKNGNGQHSPEAPPPPLSVTIPKITYQQMEVTVVGKSPLIVHAWSKKAVTMMLNKQMGVASPGRAKKDPLADFRESLYVLPNDQGYGVPAPAFKACIVSGANDVEMKMTEVKRCVHVSFYTVPLICPPLAEENYTEWDTKYKKELKREHELGCSMRQDLVRLESGVADIRFRGCFPVWRCKLNVEFNSKVLSAEQVVNLFQSGGLGCGIGEWRPSSPECRSGEFGRFSVE